MRRSGESGSPFCLDLPSPLSDANAASETIGTRIGNGRKWVRFGDDFASAVSVVLSPPSPHIQFAPRLLEHLAHLFHALERRGLARRRSLGAGGAGGDKAFDALVLLAGEG